MRLKQLCKRVNNHEKPQQCAVKHANKFVLCEEKKVYSIPLGCGDKYAKANGKVRQPPTLGTSFGIFAELTLSLMLLRAVVVFHVLSERASSFGREIVESFTMNKTNNVSASSLVRTQDEIASFFRNWHSCLVIILGSNVAFYNQVILFLNFQEILSFVSLPPPHVFFFFYCGVRFWGRLLWLYCTVASWKKAYVVPHFTRVLLFRRSAS